MTRDERRAMWQARIEAFKASGESSVTAWCTTNNICAQSMYVSKRQILPTCVVQNRST